jgi:hypothetical protein
MAGCGTAASPSVVPVVPSSVDSSVAAPASADHAVAVPPTAILHAGNAAVPGELGSYVFEGSGSDSPWLPFDSLSIVPVADAPLTVAFEDGTLVATWSAAIATADDVTGAATRGAGGRGAGAPPLAAVTIGAIPAGSWVLSVRLELADGRGDATYYWAIEVG